MKKSNKVKTPLVFRLSLVLLCAMFFTSHMMGGLYARYTTTATGSDSARVAKFDVNSNTTSAVDIELNFYDPSMLSDTVSFQVKSDSEVTVKYSVIVTMPSGMSDYEWLSIKLDDTTTIVGSGTNNEFNFTNVGEITHGDTVAKAHTLTFSIVDSRQGYPNGVANVISGTAKITVRAEQID
ncbi:MAG: hypothetical protein IJD67_00375 [Clostridia bacterium]|nr:hypothetical protein [Clostridia bacterium]